MTRQRPPGIEFVFYAIMAGCTLLAVAIAYCAARLLRKLLKVTIGPKEIVVIAAVFLLTFTASSLVLQQREDGVTVGFQATQPDTRAPSFTTDSQPSGTECSSPTIQASNTFSPHPASPISAASS